MPVLEFFLFYGSIHTYLSVTRIGDLARAQQVQIIWRPFNLREILIEQGNTGFTKNAVRLNYNWRDIERRARELRIPFSGRPPYPVDPQLVALRVGAIAAANGWCAEYSVSLFQDWFLRKKVIGQPEQMASFLSSLGRPVEELLQAIDTEDAVEQLQQSTASARDHGIFGSPSFVVNGELFWGDDRLNDAIEYAKQNRN